MAEHDERRFIILPPDDNLWCSQRRRFSSRFSRARAAMLKRSVSRSITQPPASCPDAEELMSLLAFLSTAVCAARTNATIASRRCVINRHLKHLVCR